MDILLFPIQEIQAICLRSSVEMTQYLRGLQDRAPNCPSLSELGTGYECGTYL